MPISIPFISTLAHIEGRHNAKGEPTVRNPTYGKLWTVACVVSCVAIVAITGVAATSIFFGSQVMLAVKLSAPLAILQMSVGLLLLTTALPTMVRLAIDSYKNSKHHGGNVQKSLERAYLDTASKKVEYEIADRAVMEAEKEAQKASREFQDCQNAQETYQEAVKTRAKAQDAKKDLDSLKLAFQEAQKKAQEYQKQVRAAQDILDKAEGEHQTIEGAVHQAQTQYNDKDTHRNSEIKKAEQKRVEFETDKQTAKDKKSVWDLKRKAAEKKLEDLEKKREALRNAEEELVILNTQLTEKKAELQRKNDALTSDTSQAAIDAAAAAQKESDTAQTKYDEKKNAVTILKGETPPIEKDHTAACLEASAAKTAYKAVRKDFDTLERVVETEESQAKNISTQIESENLKARKEEEAKKVSEVAKLQKNLNDLKQQAYQAQMLVQQKENETVQKERFVKDLEREANQKKQVAEQKVLQAVNCEGSKSTRADQIDMEIVLKEKKNRVEQQNARTQTLEEKRQAILKKCALTETCFAQLKSQHSMIALQYEAAISAVKEAQMAANKAEKEKSKDAPRKIAIAKSLAFQAAIATLNYSKELDSLATKESSPTRAKELKAAADKFKNSEVYDNAQKLVVPLKA